MDLRYKSDLIEVLINAKSVRDHPLCSEELKIETEILIHTAEIVLKLYELKQKNLKNYDSSVEHLIHCLNEAFKGLGIIASVVRIGN